MTVVAQQGVLEQPSELESKHKLQRLSPTSPVAADFTLAMRLRMYRLMLMSRRLDDLEIQLKRQNIIHFQVSAAGHEASLAAATCYLQPGKDWFFPYYRDRTLALGLGVTPLAMLLQAIGAADDPASGGRQMPSHWSDRAKHIVSESSPTGVQFLTAVGASEVGPYSRWVGQRYSEESLPKSMADEVIYCSAGDGTTSQGWFFEALNTACLQRLPVIFHIEDNGYAISTPVEQQTAGGDISRLLQGYPHLLRLQCDGCDVEASAIAWQQAVQYARQGQGPVLLHAKVIRPYGHSLSDEERHYRLEQERQQEQQRDPIVRYRQRLVGEFGVSNRQLKALEQGVEQELQEAKEAALAAPLPDPSTVTNFVYSPDVDPTGSAFTRQVWQGRRIEGGCANMDGLQLTHTMVDAINRCLASEMARDPKILLFGQDVADVSDPSLLEQVKGKGGVFKVTAGLQRQFGCERVFNSPLAEANIIGRAIGMALRGLKPVVEIQFFDYIWPAMMHIRSELALMRWRSNNAWSCPLVIRCTYGGYLRGGAVYHSQTGESIFTQIPGLRVVLPSHAADAWGLLRTAIRCDDPVLFLEHKHLYRQLYNRCPDMGDDYMIPLGQAAHINTGEHITLITYGALVKRSLDAIEQVESQGISVDMLDLRTLQPYDWPAICTSVQKTGKVLVVHEASLSWGYGAELAARIGDELFAWLDAPVRRVAAQDTFVAYQPVLEDAILPQTRDIVEAICALHAY